MGAPHLDEPRAQVVGLSGQHDDGGHGVPGLREGLSGERVAGRLLRLIDEGDELASGIGHFADARRLDCLFQLFKAMNGHTGQQCPPVGEMIDRCRVRYTRLTCDRANGDRFDTLCNDITTGLPAEIEARTKQYEYYRDKLLTFPERA